MERITIYHDYIPKVGGIESAVYNLAELLSLEGYPVTIVYNQAESFESLFRYASVCERVIKRVTGEEVESDICLIASNHDIPRELKSKRYLQWIHSDYDKYSLKLRNVGEVEYVAVSQHARKVVLKRENQDSTVIYNLLSPNFKRTPGRQLKLVSNTRVSPEKGFERMLRLAEQLKEANIDFVWTIFGDNSHYPKEYEGWKERFKHIEEVLFVGYKNDVTIGLKSADYLVQLSDFEGCPYSILEALRWNIPCIVTNWLGVTEIIQDGVNGYIVPMDMNNIDIERIANEIPKVEYKELSTIQDWIKLINKKDGVVKGNRATR